MKRILKRKLLGGNKVSSRKKRSFPRLKTTKLSYSELLSLRSEYRQDIRTLDDQNFKIITALSTITFAIITAATALNYVDFLFIFFAGIAAVNLAGIRMLLKNRISVLEKTWLVFQLESNLPKNIRNISPFTFTLYKQTLPKNSAYRYMINVHLTFINIGVVWAVVFQYFGRSFHAFSQLFFDARIPEHVAYLVDLYIPWLLLAILYLVALLEYFKILSAYEKEWKEHIWNNKDVLEKLEKRFGHC